MALRTRDLDAANAIKDEIGKLRKSGLDRAGEFSVENIAFKVLRAKGYIDQLRQHIYDLEDEALSLENMYETQRNHSIRT